MSEQKPKMSIGQKSAIAILIAIVIIILFVFSLSRMFQFTTNPSPSNPSAVTPSPTPTGNIAISYSGLTKQSITWEGSSGYSYDEKPNSGRVFLEVTMTVKNNGYVSFNTNPNYFYVTVDQIKYSYDASTFLLDKWETVDVLDGGTFTGTLVFQIPSTATSFGIGYDAWSYYNIVWTLV